MKLLHSYEVKKIDALGKQLDTNYHEVLLQEESEKPEGEIIEELQKGYTYKNKVLRFTKVKLSHNSSSKEETRID
jgi:molecular chaperone GrpE